MATPPTIQVLTGASSNHYNALRCMLSTLASSDPSVPVLVTRGADDASAEATAEALSRALGGRAMRRDFAGGLSPVDDREAYLEDLLRWLDGVDGTVSRRAVMATGSMMPAGRL